MDFSLQLGSAGVAMTDCVSISVECDRAVTGLVPMVVTWKVLVCVVFRTRKNGNNRSHL